MEIWPITIFSVTRNCPQTTTWSSNRIKMHSFVPGIEQWRHECSNRLFFFLAGTHANGHRRRCQSQLWNWPDGKRSDNGYSDKEEEGVLGYENQRSFRILYVLFLWNMRKIFTYWQVRPSRNVFLFIRRRIVRLFCVYFQSHNNEYRTWSGRNGTTCCESVFKQISCSTG